MITGEACVCQDLRNFFGRVSIPARLLSSGSQSFFDFASSRTFETLGQGAADELDGLLDLWLSGQTTEAET